MGWIARDLVCLSDVVTLAAALDTQGGNPLKGLSVLALPRYDRLGASSRLRIWQYLPHLRNAQWQVQSEPLIREAELKDRYTHGRYVWRTLVAAYLRRSYALIFYRDCRVVWIEKEAMPWMPLWIERLALMGAPYVLDYDDAVFHQYDLHPSIWVRCIYGQRLDGLIAGAALVIAGNSYLAARASRAGATRVEILPTVIDLDRYPEPVAHKSHDVSRLPRIVWIGSPTTVAYLRLLAEPLRGLSLQIPFKLRVIGCANFEMTGVQVEAMDWSENTEVSDISDCEIGIMPLPDTPWEQGKCGYKLIQYMACGLPVVASPVGANLEIVQPGKNGYLADSNDAWVSALTDLLQSDLLRQRMGVCGRQDVESRYCLQKTGPVLASLLSSVVQEPN
jgi:glycosyltransferase involved in cell wall biosynthesis